MKQDEVSIGRLIELSSDRINMLLETEFFPIFEKIVEKDIFNKKSANKDALDFCNTKAITLDKMNVNYNIPDESDLKFCEATCGLSMGFNDIPFEDF